MFKKNFERYCTLKGESPSSVAQKIGISASAYSQWTDKTIPRKITQQKAADYFGITVDELMFDSNKGDPHVFISYSEKSTDPRDIAKKIIEKQIELIKEKSNPATEGLDEYEEKLLNTFRQTTIDGKLRILNAADEIKKDIEKNHTGSDSTFA